LGKIPATVTILGQRFEEYDANAFGKDPYEFSGS
jgi:hypothetical protein